MKKQILFTFLLLATVPHTVQAAPTLSMSSAAATPDSSAILQLSINGVEEAYSGFNARLEYPACMYVSSMTVSPLLANSFVLDNIENIDGDTRNLSLIAYSGSNSFSTDGVLLSLIFQVGADCPVGQHGVNFATVDVEPLVNSKHAISNQDGSVAVSHQVTNGGIVIMNTINDSDQDGMDDDWERLYFGDLSHNGFADSDQDGYTDLQEYINFSNGELDSADNIFNPTVANEPGGTGYQEPAKGNFWILMMPAIQAGANGGK